MPVIYAQIQFLNAMVYNCMFYSLSHLVFELKKKIRYVHVV